MVYILDDLATIASAFKTEVVANTDMRTEYIAGIRKETLDSMRVRNCPDHPERISSRSLNKRTIDEQRRFHNSVDVLSLQPLWANSEVEDDARRFVVSEANVIVNMIARISMHDNREAGQFMVGVDRTMQNLAPVSAENIQGFRHFNAHEFADFHEARDRFFALYMEREPSQLVQGAYELS